MHLPGYIFDQVVLKDVIFAERHLWNYLWKFQSFEVAEPGGEWLKFKDWWLIFPSKSFPLANQSPTNNFSFFSKCTSLFLFLDDYRNLSQFSYPDSDIDGEPFNSKQQPILDEHFDKEIFSGKSD